jgi:hypothetical protein
MDDIRMLSTIRWGGRFFKLLSITCFFLILFALIILLQVGQASSYDFSIYDAYPWYFWVALLSAIMGGQVVIFGSAITQSKTNDWLYGLFAILMANTILLLLPAIRGYYVYGTHDVLTHIGYMHDLLQTSSIGGDHYPIDHILGVIFHLIFGLSIPDITLFTPAFFSFFFILSMYFMGKTIFQDKFELSILVILTSILTLGDVHLSFTPNSQGFFLVPLILFLAFKMYQGANVRKYNFLLLLICLLIVFFHPLVTVMIMLILFLMQIMQYFLEKYENRKLKKVNYTYTIFFMLTIFLIWSKYLNMVTDMAEPLILRFFGDAKVESEFHNNVVLMSQLNADPLYFFRLILNIYGQLMILGLLSLLCIGLIIISMDNQKTKWTFFRGIPVMGFLVFYMLSLVMLLINGTFGFVRFYVFATLFSLLLIPAGFYLFLYNKNPNDKSLTRKTMIKMCGVIFFIFCVTVFSLFNLYASPIIKTENQQVTTSDFIGMKTFFSYRDEDRQINEIGLVSSRYYDAIYGESAERRNMNIWNINMTPPDHFGYQNETLSRDFYNTSKYLVLNDKGKGFYPHMYPEFENKWRFLAKDFERLKSDNKIQKVYSNRNNEIFIIQ